MTARDGKSYCFGPFRLEVEERELRRGDGVVPLPGKAFDLLLTLVREAGRTVTKPELMAALWPGTAVEEANLTQTVFLLRKALGEDGDEAGCIRTVPRHGYKFVLPVLVEGAAEHRSPHTGLAASSLLLTATGVALMAVAVAGYFWPKPLPPGLVRFQIQPPDHVTPIRGAVISPDGRRLVFPALEADGTRRIYLREIDSLETRPLLGTEGGSLRPIWSPDSRFIAYQSSGKLMKLDISGGLPQPLCDLPGNAVGGSWNRAGVIVFGNSVGGILRVPENGGLAVPVTVGSGEAHTGPNFFPDGRHFLYQRVGHPETEGVYVGSLDLAPERQSSRRIVETSFGAAYSPPVKSGAGWILFLKDGNLLAQAFDAGKLEARGEPVLLGNNVGVANTDGFFSVSPNVLVYRSRSARLEQLTWFDRQGNPSDAMPSELRGGVISPDGARVAHQIRTDIWLYDTSHRRDTRLTFHPTQVEAPVWSPDGRQIAFAFTHGGPYDLYRKDVGGSAEVALLESNQDKTPTDWSSDGRFLLFTAGARDHKSQVWALSMTGDRKTFAVLKTAFSESQARFSPDTQWIAYTSNKSGRNEVYVRRFDSAHSDSETPESLVSSEGGSQPRWRRDGKELFYLAPRGGVMSVDVTTRGKDAVLGTPRLLFRLPLAVETFDASSNGTRFLIPVLKAEAAPAPFTVVLNWQSGLIANELSAISGQHSAPASPRTSNP